VGIVFGLLLVVGCATGSEDAEINELFNEFSNWVCAMEKGKAAGKAGPTKDEI